MTTTKETPEEHLLRSLQITAIARFIGAKRLRSHEAWSLWTISFVSLLLIFVPLFQPFGIEVFLSDAVVNVAQVLAAAVTLVFSLLVNGSKFGERAELMHGCALSTINSISRRLEGHIHFDTASTVLSPLRVEYENLLEKYENHSDLDFLFAQIRRFPIFYKVTKLTKAWASIQRWVSYTPYIALIFAEVMLIWLMLVNPADDPLRKLLLHCSQPTAATSSSATTSPSIQQ